MIFSFIPAFLKLYQFFYSSIFVFIFLLIAQRERHKDCEWFIVDKVALGQVSLRVLRFAPVSIIPPMLHNHIDFNITFRRRTSGRSLGNLKKISALSDAGERWREKNIYVGLLRVKKAELT
jgi:hypothetical protein